jgi:RNA polymerase sigma-70 factor, ECF subfamily
MGSDTVFFPGALARRSRPQHGEGVASQIDLTLDAGELAIAESTVLRPATSDELLLAQAGHGSRDAITSLFGRYARPIREIALRILRDEGEADDLVQDVFLNIVRKASQYTSARGRAGSWILHMTYHLAFDRRRYLHTRKFYSEEELGDSNTSPEDSKREAPFLDRSIEGTLGRGAAGKLAALLTTEQREIIELFFFEGYTLKEISEHTGRPIMNVRSYYYRGLERLRKFILSKKNRLR